MTTTAPQAAHQRVAASRVPAATRAFLAVLFAVYVVLLAWAVLWKLDVPWVGVDAQRVIKLVPFVRTAEAGASAPFEVFANILFFVPFGIYLRLLVPSWPWWRAAGAIAAASLSLEIAQYVLAIGSTDVSDVIANTAGGLVGIVLLALARGLLQARTAIVVTRVCAIGTVLLLLASAVFVASPLRYGPQSGGDPGLHRSGVEHAPGG